jgi:hypothetical protein
VVHDCPLQPPKPETTAYSRLHESTAEINVCEVYISMSKSFVRTNNLIQPWSAFRTTTLITLPRLPIHHISRSFEGRYTSKQSTWMATDL